MIIDFLSPIKISQSDRLTLYPTDDPNTNVWVCNVCNHTFEECICDDADDLKLIGLKEEQI